MPYCRKCGAEIDPDSKFCHDCGTQTTPTPPTPHLTKRHFPVATAILIAVLIFAALTTAVILLPFHPVSFTQSNEASAANINSLNLVLNADIANVNVNFKNLPGNQRAAINVSATGSQGIFALEKPISLAFQEEAMDSTLTYNVEISRATNWDLFFNVRVVCEVSIDPSANLSITVKTGAGNIFLHADQTLTLQKLHLETTAGNIDATVTEETAVMGPVELTATAGTAHLHWNCADVFGDIPVAVKATTGSAMATINQCKQLAGNITVKAEATTGEVVFTLDICEGVGARIEADTGFLGNVRVDQTGFTGDKPPLQSRNYPAQSNFDVTLKASTGGIQIEANCELGIRN